MVSNQQPNPTVILDRMTDAFFALDTERRLTYLNEQAREVITEASGAKLSIDELQGELIWEIVPDAVGTTFYEEFEKAIETQNPTSFEEQYEPLETWFDVRVYPSESGISVYFRDITNRKRRERRLERQARQFEGFGSILSHDLKSPLNVALGRLDLAKETGNLDHLSTVKDSLNRIEEIIDDLATVMKEGALVNELATIELSSFADPIWEMTADRTGSIEIEQAIQIQADENALTRLFENLFRNAIEHGGSDVTVRIGPLPNGFYVEDDGPGIPEDDRESIFEPGFTTKDDNSGFGLVSVRQITLAHGWDITVTSGSDGGARFEFADIDID